MVDDDANGAGGDGSGGGSGSGGGGVIVVFGSGKRRCDDELLATAEAVGQCIAGMGFVLANGGYGGTMLASARGARQAGGEVIGVTCTAFGRGDANEYVTTEIVTSSLDERLGRLVEMGDAYVVLPGGTGTLLELAHVWEYKNKRLACKDKPVIIVGGFWEPLVDMMASIDEDCAKSVRDADGAGQVGEILRQCFG